MLKRLNHLERRLSARIPTSYRAALIMALVMAVLWWLVALIFRNGNLATVWYDQETTFTQVGQSLADPYLVKGFVNPPWTAVLLTPFVVLPSSIRLPLAVLLQIIIYFVAVTAIIFKFGGNSRIVLLTLLSYFAFDSALELNLDWLVCLGLLVPPAFSSLFLLVKPQNAMGYWLSLKRRDFVRAVIVALALLALSLLIWGPWPLRMLSAIQANTLGKFFNVAPPVLITWPVSVLIGLALSWFAFRRRDPILGILAWLFFVPYLTTYALLMHFGLFAVRLPRFATLFSVVMWIIFGGTIALGLLARFGRAG